MKSKHVLAETEEALQKIEGEVEKAELVSAGVTSRTRPCSR